MLLLTALVAFTAAEPDDAVDENAFELHDGDHSALVHASVTAGAVGVGPGNPTDYGPLVAIGVPLYLGTRRPHMQWLVDSHFSVSYGAATGRLLFVVTPTAGANFYVFGWLGCELRVGVALGMRWSAERVVAGFGYVAETAVVLRPFGDDHARLKLVGIAQEILPLSAGDRALLTATAGVGFELRI